MNDEHLELVGDAVDCWDTSDDEPELLNEDIRRLEVISEKLVEGFPKSPEDLQVSRRNLKESIKNLIRELVDSQEPKTEYNQLYGSIIGGYMAAPKSSYSVGFPLNLPYGPDELQHRDFTILQMDKNPWMAEYRSRAEGHSDFDDIIEDSPNSLDEKATFWEVTLEGNDVQYVADKTESILEAVLGELIYCLQHWTNETIRGQNRLTPYAWSELKHPFVYIILKEGNYEAAYYDEDSYARVKESAPFGDQRIERKYEQIPEFCNPNLIEQLIINSLKNFHRGATEHRNEQAFFHLWRAIENLALTEDRDSTSTVLNRATSVIDTGRLKDEFGLAAESLSFDDRIQKLSDKRNLLVHEGGRVEITDADLELLRAIYYELLHFMLINHKWTEENIRWWYDNYSKEVSALNEAIKTRKDNQQREFEKTELMEKMVFSKQIS